VLLVVEAQNKKSQSFLFIINETNFLGSSDIFMFFMSFLCLAFTFSSIGRRFHELFAGFSAHLEKFQFLIF